MDRESNQLLFGVRHYWRLCKRQYSRIDTSLPYLLTAGHATFALEELPDAQCRLSFRLRARDRGFATQAKLFLFRSLIRKHWQGHYARLTKIIDEERTQAAGVVESAEAA